MRIAEFTLGYNKSFKKHHIKLLVGNTYEKTSYEFYRTGADLSLITSTPVLGNGDPIVGSQSINKTNSISYLGRINSQLQLEIHAFCSRKKRRI